MWKTFLDKVTTMFRSVHKNLEPIERHDWHKFMLEEYPKTMKVYFMVIFGILVSDVIISTGKYFLSENVVFKVISVFISGGEVSVGVTVVVTTTLIVLIVSIKEIAFWWGWCRNPGCPLGRNKHKTLEV
jgi:hypothetical protein